MDLDRDAYVDGNWLPSQRRFAVRDPFDGQAIADVVDADDGMIERAIASAARAFVDWRRRPAP